jgi:hypothetical protein
MMKKSDKTWALIKKAKKVGKAEYVIDRLMRMAAEYNLDVTDVQIAEWYLRNQDDPDIYDSAYRQAFKLFPHNGKLVVDVALRMAPTFQVNCTVFHTGEEVYRITSWSSDGYKGWLTDTVYEDGCDQTNWAEFVGTFDECLEYIKRQKA